MKGQGQNGAGGLRKGAGLELKRRGLSGMGGASPPPAPPPTPSPATAPRQPAHAASFPPSGAAGPAGPGRTPGTRTRPPGPAGGGIGGGTGGRGSHHGVPSGGVSEASGSCPREAAPVSVVRVLGGKEPEGPRRTHIPSRAWTDRWTGDTRGWRFRFSPSFFRGPLSLVQSHPSPRSFFRAPPHPRLYPFFLSWVSDPPPHFWSPFTYLHSASFLRISAPFWVSVPHPLKSLLPSL